MKPPEGNFSRVNIFGEITSLQEFIQSNLYMFYEFSLPIGWKVDNENEYYLIYKTENIEEDNINKLKSISQISESYVEAFPSELDADLINNFKGSRKNIYLTPKSESQMNKHNFCLPFELELLSHDYIIDKESPKLLLQINSNDSINRHRIEGYSFVNIPLETGFYQFEVPCYKPKEDNYMKVFSYFLGGSRKIPDLREIAKTSSKDEKNVDTVLNRYGISTEYVGKVNINLNVVIQSKDLMDKSRRKVKDKQGREAFHLISTVEGKTGKEESLYDDSNFGVEMSLMRTKNHGVINRYSN